MFFFDGVRQIDFVLVCPITVNEETVKKRLVYENNLVKVGLELEVDDDQDRMDCDERKLRYVKLHAPRKILLHMAEFMRTKMPIKECDIDTPDGTFTNFRPRCFTDNLEFF